MTHKPQRYKVRVRFSTSDEDEGGPGRLASSFSLSLSARPNLGLNETSLQHCFTVVNQPTPHSFSTYPTDGHSIQYKLHSDKMGRYWEGLRLRTTLLKTLLVKCPKCFENINTGNQPSFQLENRFTKGVTCGKFNTVGQYLFKKDTAPHWLWHVVLSGAKHCWLLLSYHAFNMTLNFHSRVRLLSELQVGGHAGGSFLISMLKKRLQRKCCINSLN